MIPQEAVSQIQAGYSTRLPVFFPIKCPEINREKREVLWIVVA
jgi:hypothetical protein